MANGDPALEGVTKLDDLAAPDDNTNLNFSTSAHGLTPKGTNVGNFLKDDGTWAAPAGGGDMLESTYDPAAIAEQLVGLTAEQTLTTKTLTTPVIASFYQDAGKTKLLTAPATTGTIALDGAAPTAHAASHQNGGGDEISVAGLSGLLADDQHVLDTEVESVITAELVGGQSIDNAIDSLIATHTSDDDAHHAKYTDAEAVDAVEAAGVIFAENVGVTLDSVLSADGKWCATSQITGTAGTALAFGDVVYLAVADSKWELCDASAAATAVGLIGIVVVAANEDATATILLQGTIRADTAFPALTVGAPVHMSETAGDVVVDAPSTASAIVRILGHALTANSMYWNPDNAYVTIKA